MFRFTIRDALWLMVVVGMSLGWWQAHRQRQATLDEYRILIAPVAMCANPDEVAAMQQWFYDEYGRWPSNAQSPMIPRPASWAGLVNVAPRFGERYDGVMQVNPYQPPRETGYDPRPPVKVLEAFKSSEPTHAAERPKEEQPRSDKWLPVVVANICYVIVGLLLFGGVWWAFGPITAAKAMIYLAVTFVACVRLLTMIGRA